LGLLSLLRLLRLGRWLGLLRLLGLGGGVVRLHEEGVRIHWLLGRRLGGGGSHVGSSWVLSDTG
jgi:hypothetical protein